MRALVLCLVLAVGCGGESPPFTYRLEHHWREEPPPVLLELEFVDYEAARDSGVYTVTLAEQVTEEITLDVGYCAIVASCAGPITLEHLGLTLQPPWGQGDHVSYFRCVGLDGALAGGIDTSGQGSCE